MADCIKLVNNIPEKEKYTVKNIIKNILQNKEDNIIVIYEIRIINIWYYRIFII